MAAVSDAALLALHNLHTILGSDPRMTYDARDAGRGVRRGDGEDAGRDGGAAVTWFRADKLITARTTKACDAGCRQPIVPGERYIKIAGVWEGDFCSALMHEDCHDLHEALRDCFDPYGEGMPFSTLECFADAGLSARDRGKILAEHRGHYPRAVCRLELAMRKWGRDK